MRPRALLGLCLLGCALRPALGQPPRCAPGAAPPAAAPRPGPAAPPCARPRPGCPAGWLGWRGSCYGYFGREATWRQAEGWCRTVRRSCHLASVLSAEEHRALAKFVRQCQRAKEEDDVWVGLQYQGKAWAWTDGSKMRYSAWDDDDFTKGKHCAVLEESSGFLSWEHDACSERNPFVCKCTG